MKHCDKQSEVKYIVMVRYIPPLCEFWKGSSQTSFVGPQTAKKEKIGSEFSRIDHSFIIFS